jgi:protein SCO1/2
MSPRSEACSAMRRRLIAAAALGLLAATWGCGKQEQPWHSTNITGLMPDLDFTLTDGQGRSVTAADFQGKTCLVYFGFTHCRGICPTTMATLAAAVRDLGPDADQVRVLFVSVDPRRDSPTVLDRYQARFGPQVVGLTGEMPALRALARRYRVGFSYDPPGADGNYVVNHSSAIFAFDGRGRVRLLMREEAGVPALAADLRRLVAE